jgi:lipoprotein NlpD
LNVNSIAEFNDLKPPYLLRPGKILRLKITRRESKQKKIAVTNNVNKGITRASVDKKTQNDAAFWSKPVKSEPIQKFGKTSSGVDYMLLDGETIRASSSGVVVYAGTGLRGYMSLVIIKHDSNWLSAYGMNLPYSIAEGDKVLVGESIAVNKSPEKLTGKFHFEVRYNGQPVDPLPLFGRKLQSP